MKSKAPIFAGLLVVAGVARLVHERYQDYINEERFFEIDRLVNQNVTVYGMWSSNTDERRARFSPGPIEPEFVEDLKLLKKQLRENYGSSSKCQRKIIETNATQYGEEFTMDQCYGLGTTVNRMNHYVLLEMKRGFVLEDLDNFTCKWFHEDDTKNCSTMFGDCYFKALNWDDSDYIRNTTECHDIYWFEAKYGDGGMHAGHVSWLMHDEGPPEPENCLALHIRRGDACVNPARVCFSFDTYYTAAEIFIHRYPEIDRIVVLTDDNEFPLEQFQRLAKHVEYDDKVDRNKYNVASLSHDTRYDYFPEFRSLNNSASELFAEVAAASKCKAVVGTLTSGISKWIYLNMLTRQGRLPMFYSLHGCMANAFYWGKCWEDDKCENPIL